MAHRYLMDDGDPIDVTGIYPFPRGAGNNVSDAADTGRSTAHCSTATSSGRRCSTR